MRFSKVIKNNANKVLAYMRKSINDAFIMMMVIITGGKKEA